MRLGSLLLVMLLGSTVAVAQSAPAANVDLARLSQVLAAIESTSNQTQLDLAKLRIDKWKAGSDHKQQAESDASSVNTNLSAALPTMIAAVRATPTALAPGLKLYRDLNAVYEVLSGLTDSANAFGHEDEARALSSDAQYLDRDRQALVDYLQSLASYKDSQLLQLNSSSGTTATTADGKKIVVYDDEPESGHAKSKKKAHPKPESPQNAGTAPQ